MGSAGRPSARGIGKGVFFGSHDRKVLSFSQSAGIISTIMKTFIELKERFKSHSAKVGVLGLGYVGLPLAVEFAKVGFKVTGFEVDSSKVKTLLPAKSYISDIESQEVRDLVKSNRL